MAASQRMLSPLSSFKNSLFLQRGTRRRKGVAVASDRRRMMVGKGERRAGKHDEFALRVDERKMGSYDSPRMAKRGGRSGWLEEGRRGEGGVGTKYSPAR